jgi:hypothetical protein
MCLRDLALLILIKKISALFLALAGHLKDIGKFA